MAKFIDPLKAQIIGGALAGGALMEDEQEMTSTLMGLGVGGFTGSMLNLDFKPITNLRRQNDFKLKADLPKNEIELLKESMLQEIEDRKSRVVSGERNSLYTHLEDADRVFDKKDIFNTISNNNIESLVRDTEDLSTLKKVRSALENERTSINNFSPDEIKLPYSQTNLAERISTRESYDTKVNAITNFFEQRGYADEALNKKVAIFSNLIEEGNHIILSKDNNEMFIGDTKFKVSSYNGEGKLSTYMDSSNVWAVQKLNPFGDMYMKNRDGNAMATAIGIKFSEAADADLIKTSLEEGARHGMKPEDLKAILMSNADINEKDVDTYIEKAYQHQIFESGERVRGLNRTEIENKATELSHRTSANTFVTEVLNETRGSASVLNTESLFRPLGTVAKNEEGSELNRFIKKLTKDLNLGSSKHSVKGDNSGTLNTYGGNDLINVNSPAERNVSTTGSRTNRVDISPTSSSGTVRAFEKLTQDGMIPREYATSVATSRYTVDEGAFNRAMSTLTDNITLNVADGASIARRKGFNDYSHTMYNREVINTGKDGKLVLSDKLKNYLKASTEGMFPTMELNNLDPLDEISRQIKILNRSRDAVAERQSILNGRYESNEVQTPERIENRRGIRKVAPNSIRNPESLMPTKEIPERRIKSEARAQKIQKRREEQAFSRNYDKTNYESEKIFSNKNFRQALEDYADSDNVRLGMNSAGDQPFNSIDKAVAVGNSKVQGLVDASMDYDRLETVSAPNRSLPVSKAVADNLDSISTPVNEQPIDILSAVNSTRETSIEPKKYLTTQSNQKLEKRIAKELSNATAAETKILDLITQTKVSSEQLLAGDLTEGQRTSLNNIISSIDNKSPELALQDIMDYRSQRDFRIQPGEYLGSDANGIEVKVSDRLSTYDLIDAKYVEAGDSNKALELVFKGERVSGLEGTHIKTFGASAKENNLLFSDESFNRALSLAELESEGYEYITENNKIRFRMPPTVGQEVGEYLSVDESTELFNNKLLSIKNSEVAVISSADGVGLEMATNISKGFYAGNIEEVLTKNGVTDYIKTGLAQAAERLNIAGTLEEPNAARRSSGWALGMMATALTEGKASSEAVMGLQVLGNKNLELLIEDVNAFQQLAMPGVLSPQEEAVRTRGILAQDFLYDVFGKDKLEHLEPADFGDTVRREFNIRGRATFESFNANNIKTIVDGSIFEKEHVDMFRLAYNKSNESLMIGSIDTSPTYNYGSGTMNKSMSYNAQTQLVHNGFGYDTIGMFGTHDSKAIYDINMITASNKKVDTNRTLNHFFREADKDSNYIKNFMDTLRTSVPEDINEFLREEGVHSSIINNDYLYYNVENANKEKFKTLAIPKQTTDRVGIYETSAGHRVRKPLGMEIISAVEKDLAISLGDNSEEALQNFNKATATLKRSIVDTIGSRNNPALKDLFALQAPNSSYSVILPAGGEEFDNLVMRRAELGESIIGISETKAKQILKSQGIEPLDFSKYLDGDRVLQTQTTDGAFQELLGLESREPTYSGNSVRPVSYYVARDSQLGDTNTTDAVFHSSKDKHYSKLMFGDYDLDHALVYNFKEQATPEQYAKFEAERRLHQQHRNGLLELADNLSIKGNNGEKVAYSLDLAVEETMQNLSRIKLETPNSPAISPGSKEFYEQVLLTQERRLQEANLKGGQRKITTPKITQLAMHLGESIQQVTHVGSLEANAFDKQAMRTMSHFLVENLIKNQHSETKVGVNITDIEKLIEAKNQFVTQGGAENRKTYGSLLTSNFENLLKTSSEEIQNKYKPHIDSMVEAELKYASNPKVNPTQVVDVPKNVQGMLDGDMNHTVGVMENIISNTGLIEREDLGNVNIERTLKNGYNEVSNNLMDNVRGNAVPLAIGAGLLAMGALMTQKDPDFGGGPSPSVRGDIGSMMLAPNVESQKQAKDSSPAPQNPARTKTGYITPSFNYSDVEKTIKQTARISGTYNDLEQDMQHSMKRAIFGDNVSSVRIDKTYDY